jgi:hypothetical protein
MTMEYPRSWEAFQNRFPDYQNYTFASLPQVSSSDWTVEHLKAYRVALNYTNATPQPLLAGIDNAYDEIQQTLFDRKICRLHGSGLTELQRGDVNDRGGELGIFFVALADVMETNPRPERAPSTRERRAPRNDEFVSGSDYGLSSPAPDDAPSTARGETPYSQSSAGLADRDAQENRGADEDPTVLLVLMFLMSVAYMGRVQHADPLLRAEISPNKKRFTVTDFSYDFVAINDSSVVIRGRRNGMWQRRPSAIAVSVEAKPRFELWFGEGPNASGRITEETLAQCVGQMVGMLDERLKSDPVLNEYDRQ